jgi:tetrahydromethanopterin S-methyltransferase subunit G
MDSSVANPVQEEGKVEWIWNEMYQVNGKSIINNRGIITMIIIIALPKILRIILYSKFQE